MPVGLKEGGNSMLNVHQAESVASENTTGVRGAEKTLESSMQTTSQMPEKTASEGRKAPSKQAKHKDGAVGSTPRGRDRDDDGPELFQELVAIDRVTKVVKGGKNFSFFVLAVVGDCAGSAGYGTGKAKDVSRAVRKAVTHAKSAMRRVPLRRGRTLHHDIVARAGAAQVQLRSAPAGTGVIAGGAMRAVFKAFGIQDIVSKSLKNASPHNVVRATFKAMHAIFPPRIVAQRRGLKVTDMFPRKSKNSVDSNQSSGDHT